EILSQTSEVVKLFFNKFSNFRFQFVGTFKSALPLEYPARQPRLGIEPAARISYSDCTPLAVASLIVPACFAWQ
ncbi:hypothetical protein LZ017_11345, partial [Pelomonas sp. CA6]|uniref:hypothetical protein n=1 Tax=Pelomonas sp. CA6 TaxID=2907999 RepID=UPI001F4C23EB